MNCFIIALKSSNLVMFFIDFLNYIKVVVSLNKSQCIYTDFKSN